MVPHLVRNQPVRKASRGRKVMALMACGLGGWGPGERAGPRRLGGGREHGSLAGCWSLLAGGGQGALGRWPPAAARRWASLGGRRPLLARVPFRQPPSFDPPSPCSSLPSLASPPGSLPPPSVESARAAAVHGRRADPCAPLPPLPPRLPCSLPRPSVSQGRSISTAAPAAKAAPFAAKAVGWTAVGV